MDIALIKKKLQALTRQGKSTIFKPTGEHSLRLVPVSEDIFKERHFYYFFQSIGIPGGILAPGPTFGQPDPVAEFAMKLRQEGTPEARLQAKLLSSRMRTFAPVLVRGEEAEGVRWWGFGKRVYEKLLNLCLDEDYDDFLSATKGHDLKVSFTKSAPGKSFPDTEVMPKPKPSKLGENAKQVEQWLTNVPNLDDNFDVKSYDELKSLLERWLSSESSDTSNASSSDTSSSEDTASEHKTKVDDAFKDLLTNDDDDDK